MIEIVVTRKWPKATYTISTVTINGVYFSECVEDTDRGLTQDMPSNKINRIKIYGKTAIPKGRYKIDMSTVSPKFRYRPWGKKYNGIVPRLLGVPCFSGVLIHPLNNAEQSLGCLGFGQNKVKGGVINAVETYYRLMDNYLIPARQRGEEIWITIQ